MRSKERVLDAARSSASSREHHASSNTNSDANREPNFQMTSSYPHGRSDSGAQGDAKSCVFASRTFVFLRFICHVLFPRIYVTLVCPKLLSGHQRFMLRPKLKTYCSRRRQTQNVNDIWFLTYRKSQGPLNTS